MSTMTDDEFLATFFVAVLRAVADCLEVVLMAVFVAVVTMGVLATLDHFSS